MSIKLEVGKKYIVPSYKVVEILYIGEKSVLVKSYIGDEYSHAITSTMNWKEYTEPKKMVKMYLWAWSDNEANGGWNPGDIIKCSEFFFKNNEDFKKHLTDRAAKFHWVKRLDNTMVEVEVWPKKNK